MWNEKVPNRLGQNRRDYMGLYEGIIRGGRLIGDGIYVKFCDQNVP